MHFECSYCKNEFDAPSTPDRCPECMRRNGLVVIPIRDGSTVGLEMDESDLSGAATEAGAPSAGSGKWRLIAFLLVLVAVAVAIILWRGAPGERASLDGRTPLSQAELEDLLAQRQARAGALELLLVADATLTAQVAQVGASEAPAVLRASRLAALLAERLSSAEGDAPAVPLQVRREAPLAASALWDKLEKKQAPSRLYSIEVAALLVAALRAVGLPAMLAEGQPASDARESLDPSGLFGYFVAVVPVEGKRLEEVPSMEDVEVIDPLAGKGGSKVSGLRVLDDLQAVGAALSLRALHESEWLLDSRQAFESSGRALRLAPRLPAVRSVRARVALSAGLTEQSFQELQAAHQLRPDAPRKVQRAGLRLVMGELEAARGDLARATGQRPADVPARVLLARIALAEGAAEEAESELRLASQHAPGLVAVERGLAGLEASRGEHGKALGRARATLERRPDLVGHILVAQLYMAAGDADRARTTIRQAARMAPVYRRGELAQQLARVLGVMLSDDTLEEDSLGDQGAAPSEERTAVEEQDG